MAEISIVHEHHLSAVQARDAAQKVADKIAGDYDLACQWEGDVLHFERSGVHGSLTLRGQQVEMFVKLGMLMSMFAPSIEAKISENLKAVFGPA